MTSLAQRQIDAVRALHGQGGDGRCTECHQDAPCATIRAIAAVDPFPDARRVAGQSTDVVTGERRTIRSSEHDDIVPIRDIVRLKNLLGSRAVAYACRQFSTGIVDEWADGTRSVPADAHRALSDLTRVCGVLLEREQPATIGVWMHGMNPSLGNDAPIQRIRDNDDVKAVVAAAREFIGT